MNEAVMKFRQELNDSVELQEKLKAGGDYVAMAKENGHEFTMDDAKSTFEAIKDSDDGLTEFELEAVSGGWGNWCFWC
jgi:predicted ribosomally synthesized peptide with nif11-like leader